MFYFLFQFGMILNWHNIQIRFLPNFTESKSTPKDSVILPRSSMAILLVNLSMVNATGELSHLSSNRSIGYDCLNKNKPGNSKNLVKSQETLQNLIER